MERKRFYYGGGLEVGKEFSLRDEEFTHCILVLRHRAGDVVTIFNGDGFDYECKIEDIGKKEAVLLVLNKEENKSEAPCSVTVFQALAKGEKLQTIAEKLTELGAKSLVCFESKFCDVKKNTSRIDKLPKTVISACKQCKRSVLMETSDCVLSFQELTKAIGGFDAVFCAYENEENLMLASEVLKLKSDSSIAIIIGPEGGFDALEIESLKNAGAKIVSLGKRILRTETASIASAGLVIMNLEGRK